MTGVILEGDERLEAGSSVFLVGDWVVKWASSFAALNTPSRETGLSAAAVDLELS